MNYKDSVYYIPHNYTPTVVGHERWVERTYEDGKIFHATNCVWQGKAYTAEEFLDRKIKTL